MKKLAKFFKARKKAAMTMMLAMVAMVAGATSVSADAIDFTGTSVGISVTDVLGTAISFIDNVVPDFILMGLGIIMAVVLVGFVFWIVSKIRRAAPGK